MRLNKKGNFSLIGLLVVALIIIGAAAYYFSGGFGTVNKNSQLLDKASTKQTVVGKAIDTAKGQQCREQLDQIRKGIEVYKTSSENGSNPPSLPEAGLGVSNDYFNCPVNGKPYTYDPQTGIVKCTEPAHANY